jgi:peptidoglycan/xylan/chitin deacetylase (PgdA/CDA1 family)
MKLFALLLALFPLLLPETTWARFQPDNIKDFGLRKTRRVSLTFDDGPGAGTEKVLEILREFHIRATFFIRGSHVQEMPGMIERIRAAGHIVANHSFNHQDMSAGPTAEPAYLVEEVAATDAAIHAAAEARVFFRSPGGSWKPANADVLNAVPHLDRYIGPIYWDIGGSLEKNWLGQPRKSADFACWLEKIAVRDCLRGYESDTLGNQGGVVLMHDMFAETAELLRPYILFLKANGFQFVALDEIESLEKYR